MSDAALKEHRAQEAHRLLHDDTLLSALASIGQDAMRALVSVDADDKIAILRLQQKCAVIDEFLSELEAAVIAGQQGQEMAAPL